MTVTLKNSPDLPEIDLYRHVSVATGSTLVFMAGQVSMDADGTTVGVGDHVAQVEQCYLNVGKALAAAGATFDDVVKLTVYIVGLTPELVGSAQEGIRRASARLGIDTPVPPLTGIGVAALAGPDYLVEIEATAVL